MNVGLNMSAMCIGDGSDLPNDISMAAIKRSVARGYSEFCKRRGIPEDDFRMQINCFARDGERQREEKATE